VSRPFLRSIPYEFLAIILGANLVIGLAGRFLGTAIDSRIKAERGRELEAIADLKLKQVTDWQEQRLSVAKLLTRSPLLLGELTRSVQQGHRVAGGPLAELFLDLCSLNGYRRVVLYKTDGEPVLSSPDSAPPLSPELLYKSYEALRKSRPVMSDFLRDERGRILLATVAPIMEGNEQRGTLVLADDPERFLYPLIRSWPTGSATGETLLLEFVGNRAVYLSALRFRLEDPMDFASPLLDPRSVPSLLFSGRRGAIEGRDYRGKPVLASARSVPGTPWVLEAKVDQEETYAESRRMRLVLSSLIGLISVGLTAWAAFRLLSLSRRLRRERETLVSRFEFLSRYSNDMVLLLDENWRIVEANDRALEAYGRPREDLLDMRFLDLLEDPAADRLKGLREELSAKDGILFEAEHRRKDGTSFPVEHSLRLLPVEGRPMTQDVARDLSERRKLEAERLALERELLAEHKLSAVGRLAAAVAHDMNNILTGILGHADAMRMRSMSDPRIQSSTMRIRQAVERGARLTHGLLAYSGQQRLETGRLDFAAYIESLGGRLRAALEPRVRVAVSHSPPPLTVRADPSALDVVFDNLAANAAEAMPGGGVFSIHAAPAAGGEACGGGPPPERSVEVLVEDTGSGMDEETRQRLFEPFFTSKEFGSSAGMGLAITGGIIRQHGGTIDVHSVRGKGTRFRILLPLCADAE
jgi:PAS domain S-box-containing protein